MKNMIDNKNIQKTEAGITLVALIITIIVLIILAAVTINAVFKNNFIDIATNSAENYAGAQVDEERKMNGLHEIMQDTVKKIESKNFSGGTTVTPPEAVYEDFTYTISTVNEDSGSLSAGIPSNPQAGLEKDLTEISCNVGEEIRIPVGQTTNGVACPYCGEGVALLVDQDFCVDSQNAIELSDSTIIYQGNFILSDNEIGMIYPGCANLVLTCKAQRTGNVTGKIHYFSYFCEDSGTAQCPSCQNKFQFSLDEGWYKMTKTFNITVE